MKCIYKIFLSLLIILFFSSILALDARAQIPPEQNPVVIVPGIMGSWNWDLFINGILSDEWDFFAIDHTFDNLIQALEDEGYVRDENLFIAFYDWRQGNATSSQNYLIPTIDEALANAESAKVDIIAHSMGGLVARSYIQSDGYRDDVDQFIMLGTPNHGSSDVYSLWEGGLVPKNWTISQKYPIKFYLWYMTTATGQTADFYDTVHQYIPSVGELMPTYDFLVDSATNELKPTDEMVEQNPLLNELNTDEEVIELLTGDIGHVTAVAGTGESTVNAIPVIPFAPAIPADEKLWKDGIPEPNPPARSDTAGDNRVMLSSAFLPDVPPPIIIFYNNLPPWLRWIAKIVPPARAFGFWDFDLTQLSIESKHADLPTKSIDQVFGALGLADPLEWTPIPEPSELFSIWVASPVEVTVTDPNGNTITKDANNIPGAIYEGEDDPLGVKMILIPDPIMDDNYTVNLTGLADGSYHLAASYFTDATDTVNTVEGTVSDGEEINYEITLNSSEPQSPITIASPDPEEDTETEENSWREMIESLINDIRQYYESGIMDKKSAQYIKNCLGKILKIYEKTGKKEEGWEHGERKQKWYEKRTEIFDKIIISYLHKCSYKIKMYKRKNLIDEQTSNDLIQRIEDIIWKIKEE